MPAVKETTGQKIAIVGMACLFPSAPNLSSFWSNIVRGVDSIRDVSDEEWDEKQYYNPDATTFGQTYCKRGGFITELAEFDPLKFGVMPTAVAGSDPDQFLSLKVAQEALADCGYPDRMINLERSEVILGRISAPGAGSMNLIQQSKTVKELITILKNLLPEGNSELIKAVEQQIKQSLQPCTSDSMPGVMPNILAGRIASKLGFRGRNLLIDAACASSMVAVETAVDDLISGRCDFALAGGVHVNSSAAFFNLFAGLGALSRTETIRPFDERADGTLLGEGIGIIGLKRLEDAIAANDRIYATILGVASSSDGFGGSVIAPSLEGEALAMRNAYAMAGVSPSTIELLEAHGTGTPTGDVIELQAVQKVFTSEDGTKQQWCAVGSIKSMIGHCQSASAIAGIIKAALSLHHKVLPPTLNAESPTTKIDWDNHPCYINRTARPWISSLDVGHPRRAAVSAFGFGGINSHTVMEEIREENVCRSDTPPLDKNWDSEVFTFGKSSEGELLDSARALAAYLQKSPAVPLKDIAYTLNCNTKINPTDKVFRLAIVASTVDDLLAKLQFPNGLLAEPERGVYFTSPDRVLGGKLAFLYPGLGSAYTNMLSDLCIHFPDVRRVFDIVDRVAHSAGAPVKPSDLIFPRTSVRKQEGAEDLASADFAVVAVLLAEFALHELLKHLEITPDALMGCSTGEFAAIGRGGAIDVLGAADTFYRLSTDVGRRIPAEAASKLRSIRVLASAKDVMPLAQEFGVYLAADLGEDHIILTGETTGIDSLVAKLREQRFVLQSLPAPIAYHTPLVGNMVDSNGEEILAIDVGLLSLPTWSCASAGLYPNDSDIIRASLTKLFAKPISLRETVLAMYADGVRKFVEVGPNGVLSALVRGILGKSPALVVASNLAARSGLTQLHHLLAALFTNGVSANLSYLYERRAPVLIDLTAKVSPLPHRKMLPLTHSAITIVPQVLPTVSGVSDSAESFDFSGMSEEAVMTTFLQTNTSFMDRVTSMQEHVMGAFLSQATVHDFTVAETSQFTELAFLNRARVERDFDQTSVYLNIDLNSDLYLLDHAIGGFISTNPGVRVHLMPLMVALEMMAEAAYAHVESGVPIRLEQVKAFKRIVVDEDGAFLRMVVTGDECLAHVELFQDDDTSASMMADIIFSEAYTSSAAPKLHIQGSPTSELATRTSLYTPSTMFHGPRMQSVVSLDTVGKRTIAGIAEAREASGWLPDTPRPLFLLDPLLLDNASQFVLFYLYENGLPATALLPFFIESIDVYGPCTALSAQVKVSASLTTLSERSTEANVEILDENGSLWGRVTNINSRRVVLSQQWQRFIADPINSFFGEKVETHGKFPAAHTLVAVLQSVLPSDETIVEWCLDYLLTRHERLQWKEKLKTEKRRVDWLLGRIAAKDAVRQLVLERFGRKLGPHDVEIENDSHRVPSAFIKGHSDLPTVLISISHTQGIAVALATLAHDGHPGVDIEPVLAPEENFETVFLSTFEQDFLQSLPTEQRYIEMTRLWSAKETAFKAHCGLLDMADFESNTTLERVENQLVLRNGRNTITVFLQMHSEFVLAYAIASPRVS